MKVFIAVDMEGLAGLVQWDNARLDQLCAFMAEDANAAVRGGFAGGATEVLVGESHGNMRNIMPNLLDPRASFLSGQPKPMNHMGGVDDSFDLALLVGYHAKAGVLRGVMAHTFAGHVFSLSFNGVEVGEIGADAALCGAHGVAVGLVTGDEAACREAELLLGKVRTAVVKVGVSRSAARCMSLDAARALIEERAADAVRNAAEFRPFTFDGRVTCRVVFTDPSYADTIEHLDFVARVDGRTAEFEGEDYLQAFERFNALHFLAPTVR